MYLRVSQLLRLRDIVHNAYCEYKRDNTILYFYLVIKSFSNFNLLDFLLILQFHLTSKECKNLRLCSAVRFRHSGRRYLYLNSKCDITNSKCDITNSKCDILVTGGLLQLHLSYLLNFPVILCR